MKRYFLFAIIVSLFITISAQTRYIVYDCNGDVSVFRTDKKSWETLKKGDSLDSNNLINARNKGSIRILDTETRRIYSNVKTRQQTVVDIIETSNKSSNSTFNNLNRQLAKNIKDSGKKIQYYSTYGATTRGYKDELTYNDSVYYSIFYGIQSPSSNSQLRLKVEKKQDLIGFTIINESNKSYYVTLACGNSKSITFCLNTGSLEKDLLLIPPHTTVDLTGYLFAPAINGDSYYLIASPNYFSIEQLEYELRYMNTPDYSADKDLVQVILAK